LRSGNGTIDIGADNAAHTINLGTATAGTSNVLNLNNTTNVGSIHLGEGLTSGTTTIRGGTGATAIQILQGTGGTVTIGDTGTGSTLSLQGGTGGINI